MQIFYNQVKNTFKHNVTSRIDFEMNKSTLCYKLLKAEPAQNNLTCVRKIMCQEKSLTVLSNFTKPGEAVFLPTLMIAYTTDTTIWIRATY